MFTGILLIILGILFMIVFATGAYQSFYPQQWFQFINVNK